MLLNLMKSVFKRFLSFGSSKFQIYYRVIGNIVHEDHFLLKTFDDLED